MISRRQFLTLGGAAFAAAAGVPLYAWQVEPHWVKVVRRAMLLEHLPPALEGRTLLQISDMHVGPRVSSAYLMRALDLARELAPDFVAFTGDFVTYRRAQFTDRSPDLFRELARVLQRTPNGKLATVGSFGNHDYGPGWRHLEVADRIAQVAGDAGIRILRNEVQTIEGIQFAGLSDFWSPEFGAYGMQDPPSRVVPNQSDSGDPPPPARMEAGESLKTIVPRQPTVVLSHNPDVQDLPIWDGVRAWVLAGHTHGGQVKPPFLPPLVLPVRNKRYTAGEFAIAPGRTMYINRGLGHLVKVRFNVRPELTLFTLRRAPTTSG